MAEVIGFLREDATHGERQTLKLLSRNLPKDFTIHVGPLIHKKLYMTYLGKLPRPYDDLRGQNLADFVG